MLEPGSPALPFHLDQIDGTPCAVEPGNGNGPILLAFFETDCPTCQLAFPYLQRLSESVREAGGRVVGLSQDTAEATRAFLDRAACSFPVALDQGLRLSRHYDPEAVPTLILIGPDFTIRRTDVGFSKDALNAIAREMGESLGIDVPEIAPAGDGAPAAKPGCASRHREPGSEEQAEPSAGQPAPGGIYVKRGPRASRVELAGDVDPYDYCREHGFGDPLPVVPPTVERVERFLAQTDLPPDEVIGLVPPNYGMATVEKIAANGVMAGCAPDMMRALIPLVRAACDEKFDMHGVQATTHFAAPLIIVNGPVRQELGFWSKGNVFSNVARANSTMGRALQLMLVNLGGARPGEIDMSALGNPGKFSYCIAENEEESPWEPLHVERGFRSDQSALTLFACGAPTGVSEHNTRDGKQILQAITYALRTVWTYRACMGVEALVVFGPEHVRTLWRDRITKAQARRYLFDNTGIPLKAYEEAGTEGSQYVAHYEEITIGGEPHYRKFRAPESIKIVVSGGTAGKFSAVIGGWLAGPRGSQMVTYPID